MTNFLVMYTMPSKEDRDGFLKSIQDEGLDALSRNEDGCCKYDYFYPVESDNTLFLWEQWESREHQKVHCQTEHFARLGQLKEQFNAVTDIRIADEA